MEQGQLSLIAQIRELTNEEFAILAKQVAEEHAIRVKRARERALLPADSHLFQVVIDGFDPNGCHWSAVHKRIERALQQEDLFYHSIYVDLAKRRRAIVRVELPSDVNNALRVLKHEFTPPQRVSVSEYSQQSSSEKPRTKQQQRQQKA